jgi:hypothetical protein
VGARAGLRKLLIGEGKKCGEVFVSLLQIVKPPSLRIALYINYILLLREGEQILV